MRHRLTAAAALVALLGGAALAEDQGPSDRQTVLEATTSLEALAGMAFGAEAVGPASAWFGGPWPEFRLPVMREDGAVTEHAGGVRLYALDDPRLEAMVEGLAVDAETGAVTGRASGVDDVTLFRTAAVPGEDALVLLIAADLAAVLSGVFGAPDLTGVPLGRLAVAAEAAGERPAVPVPPGMGPPLSPPWPDAEPRLLPLGP